MGEGLPLPGLLVGAAALDFAVGDPRWLPHPVRGIGWLALRLESAARLLLPERLGGLLTAAALVGGTGLATWYLIALATEMSPIAGSVAGVLTIYTSIAARDLARHSGAVHAALAQGDLPLARQRVGYIVGRDTADLDESEVVRAAVESVAESIVDGVAAPLFWAAILGPAGALAYRAANTLDSMFGHRDERYRRFGWASAHLDDKLNFVPARLTGALICVAAALLKERPVTAWRVLRRDARRHPSPNAGRPEAATAGALGVRLGGTNYYGGQPSHHPTMGDPVEPLAIHHILRANRLMWVTSGLFLGLCALSRWWLG